MATFAGFSLSVDLGSRTPGLVITNGAITSLNLSVNSAFTFYFLQANINVTVTYQASPRQFSFGGSAGLSFIASKAPSWVQTFFPSNISLASVNFYVLYISGNNAGSYVDFSVNVAGDQVGLQVNFNGTASIAMGNPLAGAIQDLGHDASEAYEATASALASALAQAANGVTGVYNIAAAALTTDYNNALAAAEAAAQAIANAAKAAAEAVANAFHSFFSFFGPLFAGRHHLLRRQRQLQPGQ